MCKTVCKFTLCSKNRKRFIRDVYTALVSFTEHFLSLYYVACTSTIMNVHRNIFGNFYLHKICRHFWGFFYLGFMGCLEFFSVSLICLLLLCFICLFTFFLFLLLKLLHNEHLPTQYIHVFQKRKQIVSPTINKAKLVRWSHRHSVYSPGLWPLTLHPSLDQWPLLGPVSIKYPQVAFSAV